MNFIINVKTATITVPAGKTADKFWDELVLFIEHAGGSIFAITEEGLDTDEDEEEEE